MNFSIRYIARNKKELHCTLKEDSIQVEISRQQKPINTYKFKYSDIQKVHLSTPDIGWFCITIYFKNGIKLHLKNVVSFIKEQDRLRRIKLTLEDSQYAQLFAQQYRQFVVHLHEQIHRQGLSNKVLFTCGNGFFKLFILAAILITSAFILPMAWHVSSFKFILFFISAVFFLLCFFFKLDFKKKYTVDAIPSKFLPPEKVLETKAMKNF